MIPLPIIDNSYRYSAFDSTDSMPIDNACTFITKSMPGYQMHMPIHHNHTECKLCGRRSPQGMLKQVPNATEQLGTK